MTEVTKILQQIEQGDTAAAAELLPLVYAELRKLAGHRLDREKPGQTLQATALVHEAYKAIQRLEESNDAEWFGKGIAYPLIAVANHRAGRADEAVKAFEESQALLDRLLNESVIRQSGTPMIPWIDWIEFLVNHREASIVVKGHTPADDRCRDSASGQSTQGSCLDVRMASFERSTLAVPALVKRINDSARST